MITDGRRRIAVLVTAMLGLWLAVAGADGSGADAATDDQGVAAPVVGVTEVSGTITPVIADHLADVLEEAETAGLEALVVTLDTPGGLVTSMRDIVQSFLGAAVPVIVHVAPRGADAGSAGTFITLSAHVAAMAPATTIGAATPVDLQGGEVGDKVVNNAAAYAEAIAEERDRDVEFAVDSVREGRSITADEAVSIGAVDLVAPDLPALLDAVDGRTVEVRDAATTLRTADALTRPLDMTLTRRILQALADPNVAFLLLSLSTLAILYEVANPGVGAGGVVGAVALILALYGIAVLPVTGAGVALLVVALALFAIEVAAPGIGVAAGGGTVALLLAGLFLFQRPTGIGIDLVFLLPTVALTAAGAVGLGVAAARTRDLEVRAGSDTLVGRTATVVGSEPPRVRLDGTSWRVRPAPDVERLHEGEVVRVVDRDNIDLIVTPEHVAPRTKES